jgi:hypothetical protein
VLQEDIFETCNAISITEPSNDRLSSVLTMQQIVDNWTFCKWLGACQAVFKYHEMRVQRLVTIFVKCELYNHSNLKPESKSWAIKFREGSLSWQWMRFYIMQKRICVTCWSFLANGSWILALALFLWYHKMLFNLCTRSVKTAAKCDTISIGNCRMLFSFYACVVIEDFGEYSII